MNVASTEIDITQLLRNWEEGDIEGLNQVITLVYHDLRNMANYYLRSKQGDRTLQPTALVHEVYRCLIGGGGFHIESREHFFSCARMIMRQVILRDAKRRQTLKRGQGQKPAPFDESMVSPLQLEQNPETILAIDRALKKLGKVDPRKHQILELRFFVGFSIEEIARALNLSVRTVKRDWSLTKKWLAANLTS